MQQFVHKRYIVQRAKLTLYQLAISFFLDRFFMAIEKGIYFGRIVRIVVQTRIRTTQIYVHRIPDFV